MPVFDDVFVSEIERRFANKPRSYHSDIYFVATSPERSGLRHWIEEAVADLPEASRTKVTSRLRSENSFLHTLNEVAVGTILKTAGRPVYYEHALGGLTPDWWLPATPEAPAAIVEVWTRSHPSGDAARRRKWLALKEEVAKIPVGVNLLVRPNRVQAPDKAAVRKVVGRLRQWLLDAHRPDGARIEVDGYRFTVHSSRPVLAAMLSTPERGSAFGVDDVLDAITTKVKRYRDTAEALNAALIVVVGGEPGTPIDLGLVRDALSGKNSFTMTISLNEEQPFTEWSGELRSSETPPDLGPALSAVGWIQVLPAHQPANTPNVYMTLLTSPDPNVVCPSILGAHFEP